MEPTEAAPARRLLDEDARLSESLLWQLQRAYYDGEGVDAWASGAVPSYVTSSPFTARSYARVVLGYLRDCWLADRERPDGWQPIDPSQPIYLIELGAGHGRFGYHFLHQLAELRRDLPVAQLKLCYVMTDFTESNIESWEKNPILAPLIASGELDFARFDVEADDRITLRHSGAVLAPGQCANPVIVIANYLFDTVVQDLFRVHGGVLDEGRVSLWSDAPATLPDDHPRQLQHIEARFSYRPVDGEHYGDPEFDAILDGYRQRLGHATVLFPLAALRCLRRIGAWSNQRLLVLAGDKGYTQEHELVPSEGAHIAVHGSFSLMVNLHAVGRFFEQRGGLAWHPTPRPARIRTSLFALGEPGAMAETQAAFRDAIDGFAATDFVSVVLQMRPLAPTMTLDQALALLRLSHWDATVFTDVFDVVLKAASDAPEDIRRELHRTMERVWAGYTPLKHDVAFDIARVYYALSRPLDAIRFYERSILLFGEHQSTLLNLGQCYYKLQQLDRALALIERSLVIRPDFDQARQWRIRVQSELATG